MIAGVCLLGSTNRSALNSDRRISIFVSLWKSMKFKQPLSYQTLESSCWVTSVTNALIYLFEDKKKISVLILRLLHSVLDDDGVGGDKPKYKNDWKIILEAIAAKCSLIIENYSGEAAAKERANVDFSKSVVICDIRFKNNSVHSILINGRDTDWFIGFDPDWNQVEEKLFLPNEYETLPDVVDFKRGQINVKIHRNHLFGQRTTKHGRFCMGAVSKRNITIISRQNS